MDQRERALAEREAHLAELERQVANGTYVRPTEKNFPPWLHWWSWHPDRDLHADLVGPMKKLRWLFIALTGLYALNVIGCLSMLAVDEVLESFSVTIVLSLVFLFALCPLSFEFVFFVLYKAMKTGRAIKFIIGMVMYCIWWAVLVFNIIGISVGGSCGFIVMGGAMDQNAGVGTIALIFCIGACAAAALMVWAFIWLWRYYRANGIAAKAAQEGAQMAVEYAREHPDQARDAMGFAASNSDAFGI